MNTELSNTFYEVQAEKFYQKKVEVARGVIELGQILIETKEQLPHGSWTKWLEDSRVGFTDRQARNYMKITKELGEIGNSVSVLSDLSLRKLYALASAPEEIKEDVANSNSKEEAEKKIKAYEEQLKQERLAKDALIKSNQQLQNQIEAKEKELDTERKTKKIEYRTNEVVVEPADYNSIKNKIKQLQSEKAASEYMLKNITRELESIKDEKAKIAMEKDKEIKAKEKELREYEELDRKLNKLGIGLSEREEYLECATELAEVVGIMNHFFEEKLAPVRYKRCLKYYVNDSAVSTSLRDIVEKMRDWLEEIEEYIPKTNASNLNNENIEIIDVEVQ